MQSLKDTRRSKTRSGLQEKSAISTCNERHPQSQYAIAYKKGSDWIFLRPLPSSLKNKPRIATCFLLAAVSHNPDTSYLSESA